MLAILSKNTLRSEEPALSEVERVWASRAMHRAALGDAIIALLARIPAKLVPVPYLFMQLFPAQLGSI